MFPVFILGHGRCHVYRRRPEQHGLLDRHYQLRLFFAPAAGLVVQVRVAAARSARACACWHSHRGARRCYETSELVISVVSERPRLAGELKSDQSGLFGRMPRFVWLCVRSSVGATSIVGVPTMTGRSPEPIHVDRGASSRSSRVALPS